MRFRWFELGRIDKGVTLLGLAVGGVGTLAWANFIAAGSLSPQGGADYLFFAFISVVILTPLVSALGLLLLPLKAEQRGILGFIALVGSFFVLLLPLLFQFAFYIPPPLQLAS